MIEHVTSVEKIKELQPTIDLCKVYFDSGVSAYYVSAYSTALDFVGSDVYVEFHKDILNGALEDFIMTLTQVNKVNVIETEKDFKLYTDAIDEYCNVNFTDIPMGGTFTDARVLCTKCEYRSSSKAVWAELTIRDKMLRSATLRLFDYTSSDMDFSGQYILTNLRKTQFGYNADVVATLSDTASINPEVDLAIEYIKNISKSDPALTGLINKYNILDKMKETNEDYEKGYIVVRLATELSIATNMANLTNSVDYSLIKQTIFFSYIYLLYDKRPYSNQLTSIIAIQGINGLKSKQDIISILDPDNTETHKREKLLYSKIKEMAHDIIQTKKEVFD